MQAPEALLIFPYNGNALEALSCLGSEFRFLGFVDDTPEKRGNDPHGYPVLTREAFARFPDARVLAVPGSPSSYLYRKEIIQGLLLDEDRFATVVHPSAMVSPLASVGRNVLIMAGVIITSNARVGSHTCILPNTVIHHDVVLGDWSLIGSSVTLAGGVVVEENCYVGSGSNVKNDLRIGAGALVGLGSNVVWNVEAFSCVAGNPARELKKGTHKLSAAESGEV